MLSLANRHPMNAIMILGDGRPITSNGLVLVTKLGFKHCQKIDNNILRAVLGINPNAITVSTEMVKSSSIHIPSPTSYIHGKKILCLSSQGNLTPDTRQANRGCRYGSLAFSGDDRISL